MRPTLSNLVSDLVGKRASADHPITCLNPTPYFVISDAKIEDGRVFVRGDQTCWFGESIVTVFMNESETQ